MESWAGMKKRTRTKLITGKTRHKSRKEKQALKTETETAPYSQQRIYFHTNPMNVYAEPCRTPPFHFLTMDDILIHDERNRNIVMSNDDLLIVSNRAIGRRPDDWSTGWSMVDSAKMARFSCQIQIQVPVPKRLPVYWAVASFT
jgi:hypothetical protein